MREFHEDGDDQGEPLDIGSYTEYLDRYELLKGDRKKIDEAAFDRLGAEFKRLMLRIDWEDIQLDEWKRLEELRFLLIRSDDDENED